VTRRRPPRADDPRVTTAARGLAWVAVALLSLVLLTQPGGVLAPAQAVAGAALTVTGDVRDLAVGGEGRLVLVVENPLGDDVVVRRLSAEVAGDGDCLTVTPWEGALVVPAGGTARAELVVGVAADPACAGRSWELAYRASI
jgi:hypothetical protein